MKNSFLKGLGCAVVFFGVIAFLYIWGFADGKIQAKYNKTVGVEVKDSERDMYEHSTTYVEGKVQELSKEKLELATTKDPDSRKAIIDTLKSDCANLDEKDINDASIKAFLQQIRNDELK